MNPSRARNFVGLAADVDVQAVILERDGVVGRRRNFHIDAVAVDVNRVVRRRVRVDEIFDVDETVSQRGIGFLVALDRQNENGFAVEIRVGRAGISRRTERKVRDELRLQLVKENFFGKVESRRSRARRIGRREETDGVAAHRERFERRADFGIERVEFGFRALRQCFERVYFNEIVDVVIRHGFHPPKQFIQRRVSVCTRKATPKVELTAENFDEHRLNLFVVGNLITAQTRRQFGKLSFVCVGEVVGRKYFAAVFADKIQDVCEVLQ